MAADPRLKRIGVAGFNKPKRTPSQLRIKLEENHSKHGTQRI